MKKIILILYLISMVLIGCSQPTSMDLPVVFPPTIETPTTPEETPTETPTNPETPIDNPESPTDTPDNPNNPIQEPTTTPLPVTPNPESEPENGNAPEQTTPTEPETTPTENPETGDNTNGTTENPEQTTPTEPENGNSSTQNPVEPETPVTIDAPILVFTDSISSCDYDYRFGFNVTNHTNNREKLNIFYTCDGSEPNVINGLQPGNSTTYSGYFGNTNTFRTLSTNVDSVTIKAVAYYNDRVNNRSIHIASNVVEKTFTIKQYTITFVSDLPYSNLPTNRTVKKSSYTLGNIGRYYPDVRGYWFSHFEVNGVRYELNTSFVVDSNVTIKYCWSDWEYPWYDESAIPDGYTKIESNTYDDINSNTYLTYRVTYNNYIYTFMIEKSRIRKERYRGQDYVTFTNGTVTKHAVGNNGTLGRQLANYGFSYGENNDFTRATIYDYSNHRVQFTIYTNLNESSYNSLPTEIYVQLSDLRNINF